MPGAGRRFGCNMVPAITDRGQLSFMVFKKRFRAGVFIDFMGRLTRHHRGKVYLIVDAHPAHRSRKVGDWLSRHGRELRLFFLPPYSPDLNPDGILNQDVKSNGFGRRRGRVLGEARSTAAPLRVIRP
ncbi:MAG: transposase [Acidobacteriota bacterium]